MPWFRIDDTFAFHQKVLKAGDAAVGAWVRLGSYCAAQLTDGFVPEMMARMITGVDCLQRLIDAKLLLRVDDGYQIHDYLSYQPSKRDVERDREQARKRKRKHTRPSGSRERPDGMGGEGSESGSDGEGAGRGKLAGCPNDTTRDVVDRWQADAEAVLDALNAARKRVRPSSRGIVPTYDSLKHIADRLEAGKSVEDCLHVIAVCEADYRADAGTFKWFDQVTPFRTENFEKKSAADPSMAIASQRAAELLASRPKPPNFRKKASGGDE